MKRLLLAVHDVSPVHERALRHIAGELERLGLHRYSMLVVPDYHGEWPLEEHPEFCRWLSGLAEGGVDIVLHGLTHIGTPAGVFTWNGLRSLIFTRGEGEFLDLGRDEAERLILIGKRTLAGTVGIQAESFVAPAWLYSRGTLKALEDTGFILAENRWRIWSPSERITLLRVPVANYAGGGPLKRLLASLWVNLFGTLFAGAGTLRFAVHPSDFRSAESSEMVIEKLRRLLRNREPAALRDMISAP
jgi:predicted deacetylase